MRVLSVITAFIVMVGTALSACAQRSATPILRLAQSISLPGVTGGFDHFAYDPLRKRLFLAAEDNGTVEVIDLQKTVRVRSIAGFKNPHSILLRSGASTFLVTDSGPDASALFDTSTFHRTTRLKLAAGANCILFNQKRKVVYVTAGGDRVGEQDSTLQMVDPDTGKVLRSVTIDALHLQPMALDPRTGRLFVNLADKKKVGIYDQDSLKRIGTWRIPLGSGNSPIALDPEQRRLFVVASDPGILLELDADSGKLESSIATPLSSDDMAFDPASGRVFVPGSGALSVYDVSTPGRIRLLQQVPTGKNGRTGLLFESGARFSVAVPAESGRAARVLIFDVRP